MRRFGQVLLLLLLVGLGGPAEGGIFSRKSKPNPTVRVPELVNTLKADSEERKRAAAAEELREYDPQAFPEIVPALIDALQGDASWTVRLEAAQSLGRLRPVAQSAGQALERATQSDESLRVRIQARYSLTMYQLSGYRSSGTPEAAGDPAKRPTTDEPPLLDPPGGDSEPPRPLPLSPDKAPALKTPPPAVPVPAAPVSRPSGRSLLRPFGSRQPAPPPAVVEEGPVLVPPK